MAALRGAGGVFLLSSSLPSTTATLFSVLWRMRQGWEPGPPEVQQRLLPPLTLGHEHVDALVTALNSIE